MRLTFLAPARNEAESLRQLVAEMGEALDALGGDGEIVVVDDASDDDSRAVLQALFAGEPRLRVVRMPARSGQSAALAAGFAAARGEVIVTLDGDLQNDARDAPALVQALASADLACGVRARRQDTRWRRLCSRVANAVRGHLLDDRARDTGCGLKAFRAEGARRLVRFDGWHRFFAALARREGLRVVEIEVSHRPRLHGRTNYGTLDRLARGLLDLAGVWWLIRRRLPPREGGEERPASRGD